MNILLLIGSYYYVVGIIKYFNNEACLPETGKVKKGWLFINDLLNSNFFDG